MAVADMAFWLFNPSPPWSIMVYGVPCEAGPTLEQHINELVVYLQGDYEIPLRERKCPEERCYGCHEHGIYEEIVEMTAKLEETVGANPHASHYGEMDCRLCHQMHKESPLIKGCYACHHAGTFESCTECHGTAAGGMMTEGQLAIVVCLR